MKRAFLFPGQGAQYVKMGKDFYDSFSIAKETFQEADERLKRSLSKLIFEGPEESLTRTENSQLAIFVTSMAIYRVLSKELASFLPCVMSGLSLGEYTALCASGRLGFAETVSLVEKRAFLMNEACEKTSGGMAAVLGLEAKEIEEALQGQKEIWPANFNAPGQTVISGTKEGIKEATILLKEKGAKRVIPLAVHGAFHSGLMLSAQKELAPWIESIDFAKSSIEWVMNVPGDYVANVEQMRSYLIAQVTQPVRWEMGIQAMQKRGVEQFIEVGCGKTLSGLNRKIGITQPLSIEKVEDLETLYAFT